MLSKIYLIIFPLNTRYNLCYKMQDNIIRKISNIHQDISVSVVNQYGDLIVDINGDKPRIPASNQKLISTAYSLERLGPNYRFKTLVSKKDNKTYQLFGSGDPDLNHQYINKIVKTITDSNKNNKYPGKMITLNIYEEHRNNWWPVSWNKKDREEIYGAPITRLAFESNSSRESIDNPINNIKYILSSSLNKSNINFKIRKMSTSDNSELDYLDTILRLESAPLYGYITLANSQSHNFTSEILLRNALNSWNIDSSIPRIFSWLRFKRLDPINITFTDASGLSRKNRITTNFLSLFLHKMRYSQYSDFYYSSMSLYGHRGTLRDMEFNNRLSGIFLGKTGTLKDVSSVSGILNRNKDPLFVSIIRNNHDEDDLLYKVLNIISLEKCS